MAVLQAAPPALSGDLSLFHTTDPFLTNAPVLIFYGPAATVGAASSRIQLHIFTVAGHASYNRLAVSPTSPYYTAVRNLPREEQGDEAVRSIAYGLRKYFDELPQALKAELAQQARTMSASAMFGDDHVAVLASRLSAVQNVKEVSEDLVRSFAEQKLSWASIDVILPPGAIKPAQQEDVEERSTHLRYGKYAEIVSAFGDSIFLPTSRLKRAPSTASSIGRTASFMRQQKLKARQEVMEFVTTEQNYVDRLQDLEKLQQDISCHLDMDLLDSVSAMLKVNQDLLSSIQEIISSTSSSSEQELDTMTTEQPNAQQIRQDLLADNHGIVAFSKCLCERLPHFRDPYNCYMKGHEDLHKSLRSSLRGDSPPAQLTKLGEQRVTSLLIEPIQRLPRYTLYIDEVSRQLPSRHPALKHLLKARDVVSSICEDGDESGIEENVTARLRARIEGWPEDLNGVGRLITAVDYVSLRPPYNIEQSVIERGLLLVSTDGIAMVEKSEHRQVSARVFLTDIDAGRKYAAVSQDFTFLRWLPLGTIECSESHEGQSICLTIFPDAIGGAAETSMILLLEGNYEGKAVRFTEDIAKARVEARFSEEERTGSRWEVRAPHAASGGLRLLSALFDDTTAAYRAARKDTADIRVIVDVDKHSQRYRASKDGAHTVLTISTVRDGNCRLSVDTIEGASTSEQINVIDLTLAVQRRVAYALAAHHSIIHVSLISLHIHHNREVLQSIQLRFESKAPLSDQAEVHSLKQSTSRPISPVKMLSSLLSSSIGPSASSLKKELSGSSLLKTGASFSLLSSSRSNITPASMIGSRPASRDQPRPTSSYSSRSLGAPSDSVKKLEETLAAYILALKSRKGNIVGRNLRLRAEADELAVNEVYNQLLEHPHLGVVAAQAPLDVLFASFENFLRIAWTEQLGPVLPMSFLTKTQIKADTLFPADFDEYFRSAVSTLPSACQTAFRDIINLLNDLLDGTGNDADRGALTAAFAEVLVSEGDAIQYIALIDKFVNDAETYFGEPMTESMLQLQAEGRTAQSHKRSRSVNTGSLTSNTSSLRRKFGLGGLSRENSRSETDKPGSVWRTLSKSRSKEASPGSTLSAKSTLQRSHSTDSESRFQDRPISQDGHLHRSTTGDSLTVPTVTPAILPGLTTIGEHPSFIPTGPPRKKRRSSLSDLTMLATPFATPQRPTQPSHVAPTSPVASTPSSKNNSMRIHTPARLTPRPALPPNFRQEITPLHKNTSDTEATASPNSKRQSSNIPMLSSRSPSKVSPSTPQRAGLSERTDRGNIMKRSSPRTSKTLDTVKPPPLTSPQKKMRLQSPQKIRDRLHTEQAAIKAAHSTLQDELRKLGDEFASTPSRTGSVRATSIDVGDQQELSTRMAKLESSASDALASLANKYDKVQADALASLVAYESRSKKLDELYREANAENEALYSRFNDELAKVLKAVRGGEGVEQLKQRAKQQEDEVARLKRENARLKREIAGAVNK